MTLGLAITFKIVQNFLCLGVIVFFTELSSTDTNSSVHQNARSSRRLTSCNYFNIFLALTSAVTNLTKPALIFHEFPGPTIKLHALPGLENEILKFHDFPSFPIPERTLKHVSVRKTI